MSTSSLGAIAKNSIGWSIGLSVLMILAGILAIAIPPAAGIAVLAVVAWLLMLRRRRPSDIRLAYAKHGRNGMGAAAGHSLHLRGRLSLAHPVAAWHRLRFF